jgi:DNA-binding PadR family transcriptional regulator
MERAGLLRSELKNVLGRRRRIYTITAKGRRALEDATVKVDELHHELHEVHPRRVSPVP